MNVDGSPGVTRRLVAIGLAKLREEAGLSQQQAAAAMKCSHGRISNLEVRRNLPRLEFLEKLLRVYGRDDLIPRYTEMLDLARKKSAWEGLPGTRLFSGFEGYLELEEGASEIDKYESTVIPGLLQTEAYMRSLLDSSRLSRSDIDSTVQLRLLRQECITRDTNPATLWVVLDEFALDRTIGGANAYREQLKHLLDISDRPNVQIQVLPPSYGVSTSEAFTILHFSNPEDPGVVYVETLVRPIWFEDQEEISAYTNEMNHLRAVALDQQASLSIIEKKRKEV